MAKANIFIARQISENIIFIVERTDAFNSSTLIVHDTVIPYGTENKLFYYFILLFAKWERCHGERRQG